LFISHSRLIHLPRRGVAGFHYWGIRINPVVEISVYFHLHPTTILCVRVLIVGAGKAGTTLVDVVKTLWPPPFYLVGLIDERPQKNRLGD
jgi:FlaA1/EpsC-like NDP-sugar epimerase